MQPIYFLIKLIYFKTVNCDIYFLNILIRLQMLSLLTLHYFAFHLQNASCLHSSFWLIREAHVYSLDSITDITHCIKDRWTTVCLYTLGRLADCGIISPAANSLFMIFGHNFMDYLRLISMKHWTRWFGILNIIVHVPLQHILTPNLPQMDAWSRPLDVTF